MDPEGILKGSAINDLINKAINTAKETDFKLLKNYFVFVFINYYICDCIIGFIS